MMTLGEYQQFAEQGYNRIPLMREVMADLDTPLSAYLKLAAQPHSYLFESVQGGETWGRYSIIGLPCSERLVVRGDHVTHYQGSLTLSEWTSSNPLDEVERFSEQFKAPQVDGWPRFFGGLVGYFGYDTVRYIEPKLARCEDGDCIDTPDIVMMVSDELVIFDNLSGKLSIVVHGDGSDASYRKAFSRLDALQSQLLSQLSTELPPLMLDTGPLSTDTYTSSFSQQAFQNAVDRVKQYILSGDCMQVVLSQRLSAPFDGEPLNIYRALRTLNPSPYLYFLDMGEFQIAGSSPEVMARLEDGKVTVRPIAGTRRRGHSPEEDRQLEQEMIADPKECAEHLMLIDLGRNDVGRVSKTGTVKVVDQMHVERYSHVMHLTSTVTGDVSEGHDAISVVKATLPAGTLSGAPKLRAIEIIDELEPVKRGVYGGAIGYMSWNGELDTAIAIRTAVIKQGKVHVQAGAGVVADSQPELEWKETMNKARAVIRAVAMASRYTESLEDT